MPVSEVRRLREERKALHEKAAALLKKAKDMTAEDRQAFDKMFVDIDQMTADIERLEREAKFAADHPDPAAPPNGQVGNTDKVAAVAEYRLALREHRTAALTHMRAESATTVRAIERRYFDALKDYLAKGPALMSDENRDILAGKEPEFRDMGIGTNTLGGYFVPQGFVYKIEEALKYYGNMLGVADILDTATGQPLPYPTDNDTTVSGELVGEGQQVSDADVSVGHIVFNAWKFSTKMVKVSLELLQDSAFDMEAYIQKKFAIRLGRALNTQFTVGTGSSAPYGIMPAILASGASTVTATGSAANDGSSNTGTNSIGYADLVDLEHSVDPLYRRGAKYMFHDSVLKFLKTLLDKYGRPLWVPGVTSNAPDTILGYPYSINNDMAVIAASAVTVAFGALDKYLIRRVKELGVMRLNERFADYGQVAFIGFARYDGNLLDAGTHPINTLTQHS